MSGRDDEVFGIERRKAIVTAALAIVLLVVAVFLIGELASFGKMTSALKRADGRWFAVCLAGELAAYVGYIAAYRDVARADGGPRLPLWTVTRVVVVGFGAYIAGSSAGTLGVDYWALQKAGDAPHRALRRVLALNTLQWAVLALAAMLAAIGALAGAAEAPLSMELAWLVVLPACVAGALWFTAPRRVERFAARPAAREGRIAHVLRTAFAVRVGLLPLVLAYTTAYAVTSLPLPAGGAGGVEAGLAFSLKAIGVPLASALLATLVYRFFTLWLPIALAAVAVPQVKQLAEELPHVEHEPAPG
jgi:uncharacterized membrane protein YbhN (UPF0104 family)